MKLLTPSDFDHTLACYVTDYIQASLLLLTGITSLLLPLQNESRRTLLVRLMGAFALPFVFLYSTLGGAVHQFYFDEEEAVFYNYMWDVGLCLGFIGFLAAGAQMYLIYFPMNKWAGISLCVVCMCTMILPWTIPEPAQFILTGITFIDVGIFFVGSIMLLKNTTSEVKKAQYKKVFAVQMIALVLVITGAACQMMKVSIDAVKFNYNALYHTANLIGLPVMFATMMFAVQYEDNYSDKNKWIYDTA
ncbi:Hypothetical_protein [Hexamita inflata]|uniref:Hypothetical_protein n=1 Tax=Hexamita inflata TaxID=28002 RepID=A0AA86RM12_9EUKA|nr:Hypothetical protein HINF_LOCUS64933 [Hexamita inflata]